MTTNTERLKKLFEDRKKPVLNIFLTAGYPSLNDLPILLPALEKAGVDMVEIGMPYSDPLADGPTIQESSSMALKNGMHLDLLFEQIKSVRSKITMPLVLMGYFNQVLQYGTERFIRSCQASGVDGLILPDLPLIEYERSYKALFDQAGLPVSLLICPSTSTSRIRKIESLCSGFLYVVADSATTGNQSNIRQAQLDYFKGLQQMGLKPPTLIGFGISDKQAFQTASEYADGAIIGSAFLRALKDKTGEALIDAAENFVNGILN